jgi:hypothetical protein
VSTERQIIIITEHPFNVKNKIACWYDSEQPETDIARQWGNSNSKMSVCLRIDKRMVQQIDAIERLDEG